MEHKDGKFIRHEPCPYCHSKDNVGVYDDGHAYCFGCNRRWTLNEEEIEQYKMYNERERNKFMPETIKLPGQLCGISDRSITLDTCKKFGVTVNLNQQGITEHYYPYYDKDGNLIAYKKRIVNGKMFSWTGDAKDSTLFGMNAFPKGGRYVTLCEGECFKGDTEVLTKKGWKRLDKLQLDDDTEIMSVDDNGNSRFEYPFCKVEKEYNGLMLSHSSNKYSVCATENHNMVAIIKGKMVKKKFNELPFYYHVPVTVDYDTDSYCLLDDLDIRLMVAISADGTIDVRDDGTKYIRMSLKKERKIKRIENLLQESGIVYHKGVHSSGNTCFCFKCNFAVKTFDYETILSFDKEQRDVFIEELQYWDGYKAKTRNQIEYYTTDYTNATIVQTVAHLSGLYAGICTKHYKKEGYKDGYTVRICFDKSLNKINIQGRPKKEQYNGMVYCVQVHTGRILIRNNGHISVCGNCDAMACYQMFSGTGAYVSLKNGSKDLKAVKDAYEWLDSFENIIVCVDGDSPGRECARKIIEVLPPGKTKVVKMPESPKDANDFLKQGKVDEFKNLWWKAEDQRPEDVVNINTTLGRVLTYRESHDYIPTPWSGLNELIQGTRAGQLVVLTAGSGQGKSSFMRAWMIDLLRRNKDIKIGCFFMEESIEETIVSLMSLAAGENLKRTEIWDSKTQEELTSYFNEVLFDGRIEMFEPKENMTPDYIVNKIRYMAMAKGCKIIFLDHLSILVDSSDNVRMDLNRLCKDVHQLCVGLGITVIAAIHLRKSQSNVDHESGAEVRLDDIKDSSSVKQLSDVVIAFERNGQSDVPKIQNLTKVRVLKNRDFGEKGLACGLMYDRKTTRLDEIPKEIAMNIEQAVFSEDSE